eukprot:771790-Pleurochrysis_carterae.AAC.3
MSACTCARARIAHCAHTLPWVHARTASPHPPGGLRTGMQSEGALACACNCICTLSHVNACKRKL